MCAVEEEAATDAHARVYGVGKHRAPLQKWKEHCVHHQIVGRSYLEWISSSWNILFSVWHTAWFHLLTKYVSFQGFRPSAQKLSFAFSSTHSDDQFDGLSLDYAALHITSFSSHEYNGLPLRLLQRFLLFRCKYQLDGVTPYSATRQLQLELSESLRSSARWLPAKLRGFFSPIMARSTRKRTNLTDVNSLR
jgi:hypothetical protein